MPCTAGIKVTAAHVGVTVSDAHMMMGWNAVTVKHKRTPPRSPAGSLGKDWSTAFSFTVTDITLLDLSIGARHGSPK